LVFFTQGSPFSNFHKAPFVKGNVSYLCSEQYIQAMKAETFNDDVTRNRIMRCTSPYEMKNLGNQVKNFVTQVWHKEGEKIAHDACLAKFSQNEILRNALCETNHKSLGEATSDMFWGVGLTLNDERVLEHELWTGKNNMGKVLMKVREELKNRGANI